MSRLLAKPPRVWRLGAWLGVGALALASCANATSLHVTGLPSIGISVPLRTSACTLSGSCIAVGTTGSNAVPTSVGEYREPDGAWSSLVVPSAPSSLITSASCLATECLIGGIQPSGNLLWNYNASSQSVAALASLRSGQGIRALSCFGVSSCAAVITDGVNTVSKIAFSTDDGATWSTQTPLPWSMNETVTDMACTNSLDCIVSATNLSNSLDLEVTLDGGVTWTQRMTRSSWTDFTSLTCSKRDCVGLASSNTKSYAVTTATFGRHWLATALPAAANALACTSLSRCVVVGQKGPDRPWFATDDNGQLNIATLQYVPSPLISVACAHKVCTANGVSTVLTYRP
jgi:hypothetical protein